MAKIDKFEQVTRQRNTVHNVVKAEVHSFEIDGKTFLQVDTLGRSDREIPGKISQSVQFDIDGARRLKAILERTFRI